MAHRSLRARAAACLTAAIAAIALTDQLAWASWTTVPSKVVPGIVDIDLELGFAHAHVSGSGLVLSAAGDVLTNNHLIRGATTIRATDLGNRHTYTATVVGYDITADLALLHLDGAARLVTVPVGNASTLTVGAAVLAVGNAGNTGKPSWTAMSGTVTGLDRSILARDEAAGTTLSLTGLIESSAQIEADYAGGALVGPGGRVVGLITAYSSVASYAIPIGAAVPVVHQIENGPASPDVHRGPTPFLGVLISPSSLVNHSGVLIAGVVASSPAARAGLVNGDLITAVNGQPIVTPTELTAALLRERPGAKVWLTWQDNLGHVHTAVVTLASGPPE